MTEYQDVLIETIGRGLSDVSQFARHFPRDRVEWDPLANGWSVKQNLHHMREVEERYLDRLEGVLREGREYTPPAVQPSDADPAESLESIVEGYGAAREKETAILKGLSGEEWRCVFVHATIWGEISVEWWAERMVEHTADHLHNLWMLRQLSGLQPESLGRFRSMRVKKR